MPDSPPSPPVKKAGDKRRGLAMERKNQSVGDSAHSPASDADTDSRKSTTLFPARPMLGGVSGAVGAQGTCPGSATVPSRRTRTVSQCWRHAADGHRVQLRRYARQQRDRGSFAKQPPPHVPCGPGRPVSVRPAAECPDHCAERSFQGPSSGRHTDQAIASGIRIRRSRVRESLAIPRIAADTRRTESVRIRLSSFRIRTHRLADWPAD